MRPETLPALRASWMASRMAKGEAVPSSVTGMMNSSTTATNEPNRMPISRASKALADSRSTGREIKGTSPMVRPAQARMP